MNRSTGKCTKEWMNDRMSDCANEHFYVWLIEKFSWFEVHMAGYVKETCFANRLMLYRSLKAKNSVLYL